MSRVKPPRRSPNTVLCIVIGTASISFGVRTGRGSRAQWIDNTQQEVPITPSSGATILDDVLDSLLRLQTRLVDPASVRDAGRSGGTAQGITPPNVGQVRVLIVDSLLGMLELPWSSPLQRRESATQYAQSQLGEAGFDTEALCTVRLDDVPFGRPRLVVGYPDVLLAALTQLATGLGGRLRSVLPVGVAAWSFTRQSFAGHPAHSQNRGFGVIAEDALLLGQVEPTTGPGAARLVNMTVRGRNATHSTDVAALRKEWQRLRLRHPHLAAQGEHLPVLDLARKPSSNPDPAAALELIRWPTTSADTAISPSLQLAAWGCGSTSPLALDAVRPRARATALQWLTLAGLALLITLASVDRVQTRAQIEDVKACLTQHQQAAQASPKPRPLDRLELARLEAVNAAVRQLNRPMAAVLHALQPPKDIDVAILVIETQASASTPVLKIEAQAPTGAAMVRYVSYVSTRWPMAQAHLVRHEVDAALPNQPYRFSVEARWRE